MHIRMHIRVHIRVHIRIHISIRIRQARGGVLLAAPAVREAVVAEVGEVELPLSDRRLVIIASHTRSIISEVELCRLAAADW